MYTARLHDLDAHFRLVALQALIGAQGLEGGQVPAFLAAQAKRYGDPYSGAAMGWDAARKEIFFEPRASRERFSAGLI
jgi:hypothetical protein